MPGRPDVEDYAEYRLLYPEELERGLDAAGFAMLAPLRQPRVPDVGPSRHHDRRPRPGRHAGRKLYAFARRRPMPS
jgi:hypothetical protein